MDEIARSTLALLDDDSMRARELGDGGYFGRTVFGACVRDLDCWPSPPATEEQISTLQQELGCMLPDEYLQLLRISGEFGLFIHLGENLGTYMCFFNTKDVQLERMGLELPEWEPDFVPLARSGGGMLYGWDKRTGEWVALAEDSVGNRPGDRYEQRYGTMQEFVAALAADDYD